MLTLELCNANIVWGSTYFILTSVGINIYHNDSSSSQNGEQLNIWRTRSMTMFKNKNGLPKTSANPPVPEVEPPLEIETRCEVDAAFKGWIRISHGGNPLLSGIYIVQVKTEKYCQTVHQAFWSGLRWSELRRGERVIAWRELPEQLTDGEIDCFGDSIAEYGNAMNRWRIALREKCAKNNPENK